MSFSVWVIVFVAVAIHRLSRKDIHKIQESMRIKMYNNLSETISCDKCQIQNPAEEGIKFIYMYISFHIDSICEFLYLIVLRRGTIDVLVRFSADSKF